jgi:hypothetical protein
MGQVLTAAACGKIRIDTPSVSVMASPVGHLVEERKHGSQRNVIQR